MVPADKEWTAGDDNQFWRLTAVEKGRKLFARLIAQLSDQAQAEAVGLLSRTCTHLTHVVPLINHSTIIHRRHSFVVTPLAIFRV